MLGSQQGNANCVFIRGATTCENTAEDIGNAACELVNEIFNANVVSLPMVSAMFFTVTPDLTAANPCTAVRKGLNAEHVAFMCMQEAAIDGMLQHCIRVCVVVNSPLPQSETQFVYLRGASDLRK